MQIGFTGTREGLTPMQLSELSLALSGAGLTQAHHGVCVGGDEQFHHRMKRDFPSVKIIGHPTINQSQMADVKCDELMEPAEYLERNKAIVKAVHFMVACPRQKQEQLRSGTWATIRYTKQMNNPKKLLIVIYPDGEKEMFVGQKKVL